MFFVTQRKSTKKQESMQSFQKCSADKSDKQNVEINRSRKRRRDGYPSHFKMDQLNNTLITTKRLSTGMKGIFGNGKQSNSVYRDIQQRVSNRKITNAVASEIETSLMKIVSKKDNSADSLLCDQSKSSCYSDPTKRITPTMDRKTPTMERKTPTLEDKSPYLKSSYLMKAARIKKRIPTLSIFKDWDYLSKLKDKLIAVQQTKHSLTIHSKLQNNEVYNQEKVMSIEKSDTSPSQESGAELNSLLKKKTKLLIKSVSPRSIEETEDLTKRVPSPTKHSNNFEQTTSNFIRQHKHDTNTDVVSNHTKTIENSGMIIPPSCESNHQYFNPNNNNNNNNKNNNNNDLFNIYNKLPLINNDNKWQQGNGNELAISSRFSHYDKISNVSNSITSPVILDTDRYVEDLLKRPINMLRCDRSSKKNINKNNLGECTINRTNTLNRDKCSDFLDFIDSIPIHTLEEKFLLNNCGEGDILSGLKKPVIESPSPPKLYRMNMF